MVNRLTTGATWRCARFRRPRQTSTPCGSIRACGGNARLAGPGRFTKRPPTNKAANNEARSTGKVLDQESPSPSNSRLATHIAHAKRVLQGSNPISIANPCQTGCQGCQGERKTRRRVSDIWWPSFGCRALARPRAEPPCQMRDFRLIAVCAIAKVLGAGVQ